MEAEGLILTYQKNYYKFSIPVSERKGVENTFLDSKIPILSLGLEMNNVNSEKPLNRREAGKGA